ncbi:MAG: sialidase family protein [Candidatus Omnitrophota bacterium]
MKKNRFMLLTFLIVVISSFFLLNVFYVFGEVVFLPSVKVNDADSVVEMATETSLVIDGDGNIYIAWIDIRNAYTVLYVAKSIDGGRSFGKSVRVSDPKIFAYSPSLAVDSVGNIYAAWISSKDDISNVYFAKSIDGGLSFGTAIRVDDGDVVLLYMNGVSIAVSGDGNIYIAWTSKQNGKYGVYLSRSNDGGMSFQKSTRINDDTLFTDCHAFNPSVAVDRNGIIYVAWRYCHADTEGIYFSKSIDSGVSFGTNIRVTDTDETTMVLTPSLCVDALGKIYIGWTDVRGYDYNLYFSRSINGGISFEKNIRINNVGECAFCIPSLALDNDSNVYMAWEKGSSTKELYLSKSTDCGISFGSPVRAKDGDSYHGEPSLAISQNNDINISWNEYRNGKNGIYFDKGVDNLNSPIIISNVDSGNLDDLIIDFGSSYGIWIYYNDSTWSQLSSISPQAMVRGNIDGTGSDDLVIDFGPQYGIWSYSDGSTWTYISDVNCDSMVTGDIDGDDEDEVIIDFGAQYGIWSYKDGNIWNKVSDLTSRSMAAGDIDGDGKEDIFIGFDSQYGLWVYRDGGMLDKISDVSPEAMAIGETDSDGKDELIIDFGVPYGLWIYEDFSVWTNISNVSPVSLATGDIDGNGKDDIAINFGSQYCLWVYYDTGAWAQISSINPDYVSAGYLNGNGQADLIIDFGPQYGVWIYYDNGTWAQLNTVSP